ncbi:CU044_5270 family protein [Actinomadura sp. WMMA1423]|uniref:CU044_5270 family protein n=1 Tax=Actinomadura sp. WMMA1423 TaxID=2591108 RepID=UPI00114779A7|nr:CU044_5270 family protein [Actinomadura sp. WMMA1423]
MRDVMRVLRDARPEELDPGARVDEGVRRAELARAMAAPRSEAGGGAPARRRMRPIWGLGLAGAVAAGAVAAAAVFVAPGGDEPAPGKAGGGGEQVLDARTVLLAAAEKADGQTETMRAFWYQTTVSSSTYTVGKGGGAYTVAVRSKEEGWTPSRPGGKQWGAQQELGAKPATRADEEAWRRAGAPGTFQLQVPVAPGAKGPLKKFTARTSPGPRTLSGSPLVDGDKVFWLGRNVSMKDLRALPSDPKRLKAQLLRWYEGHDTEGDAPMTSDRWLYTVARGLVMDMPVKPAVRAAAFRMLAGLPSVRSLGKVTDPQGRTGTAIALDEKTRLGVLRDEMIIDLASGRALASMNVMVSPAPGVGIPAGRTMSSTSVVGAEWTDSRPR